MKQIYKYIEFLYLGQRWTCLNKVRRDQLGVLEYNHNWKKWEYVPREGTGYTPGCLRDIADFMDQL